MGVLAGYEGEREESWRKYSRRVTARLKKVRKGTWLQNIRSKHFGVAIKRINRNHPFVQVQYLEVIPPKEKGGGLVTCRKRRTAWHVDNVRVTK